MDTIFKKEKKNASLNICITNEGLYFDLKTLSRIKKKSTF